VGTVSAVRLDPQRTFNVTNAVRANDPTGIITNVNFGRITAVQPPRIMQFAVKYVF